MIPAYDLIVIGGGSAGLVTASGAAQFGAKVALVERETGLGGDCLHYGCVPSKALIAAAKEIYEMKSSAAKHGFEVQGETDWSVVRNQIQSAVNTIQEHDSTENFEEIGIEVIHAEAEFVDEHHLKLSNGRMLEGKRIVIATGSRPIIPEVENMDQVKVITNETVFYMDDLPKHIVMIGGGPIGLEMAQALSRLGSEVTVVENSAHLLEKEDNEIAEKVEKELRKEVTMLTGSKVVKVEKEGNKTYAVTEGDSSKKILADALFAAAGRSPNTENLQLERAGVKVNEKGAPYVNERLQTSAEHIYAAGDVNGQSPFTHSAGEEAKIVISNAVFGLKRKISYENVPWAFYTQPEIFHVGLTEVEAKEKFGNEYYVLRAEAADRMIAEQDQVSFVKAIIDKKGYILGAHGIGNQASDWMQTLVFMKTKGHKLQELSSVVHPYPARTEVVKQLADHYWRDKLFNSKITDITEKYVQWLR